MADPVLNVFLSAVTKELGSYRAEVAKALREKGLHVNIQEDVKAGPARRSRKSPPRSRPVTPHPFACRSKR